MQTNHMTWNTYDYTCLPPPPSVMNRASGNQFAHLSFDEFDQQHLMPRRKSQLAETGDGVAKNSVNKKHKRHRRSPRKKKHRPPPPVANQYLKALSRRQPTSPSPQQPPLPTVDWLAAGKVTPVRDQQNCGEVSDMRKALSGY